MVATLRRAAEQEQRAVAQLGSALHWGCRGRRFKSCQPDRLRLRSLGLSATSAGAMRSIRSHADRLGLDYGHFTGQRRWTDADLRRATATCHSWAQVAELLGLAGGSSTQTVKGHARRLGLDTSHFTSVPRREATTLMPDRANLPRGGALLTAAWFELCGQRASEDPSQDDDRGHRGLVDGVAVHHRP
jgi:hypothetical protein